MYAADMQIVELAAFRGRAADLSAIASTHGITLPEMGRAIVTDDDITLCIRPNRWILAARRLRASFLSECGDVAAAVDLSSALTAFRIQDSERLVSGCRVDLDARIFQEGHAAATIIAQVQVILTRLPNAMSVLTPSTTARHFNEWLGAHPQ